MTQESFLGWFRPLTSKPKEREIIGFDIEGIGGPDGFVCGAIVGDSLYSFYTDRAAMWQDLLRLGADGYDLYSHNAQYDLPILEGPAFPSGDMLFTRYGLLWSKYKFWDKTVKIFDSTNLFPRLGVADIGAMVGYPKLELSEQIFKRLAKGTPWAHFLPQDQELIRKYCMRDAEIVFMGVASLQELVLSLGGQMKPTIAGVAMDLYRRSYHKWPWRVLGPATNKFARPAYYGGRVENYAIGQVPGCNLYDVTSLYPFIQSEIAFPHPNHMKIELAPAISKDWDTFQGVVRARVNIPESFIPPLPKRFDKRLFFPTGEMWGEWPIIELLYAMSQGVKLLELEWLLGSKVTFNPFGEFVEDLFKLRARYLSQGAGQANLIKLIMNSLYGRWGLNPDGGLYRLVTLGPDPDFSKLEGYETQDLNGVMYAYGPIQSTRQPQYVNVLFAAQISAGARIFLHKELYKNDRQAIYTDTDSVLTRGEIPTGDGLGAWRRQMEAGVADLLGPKEYKLHNEAIGQVFHVKGVPAQVAEEYFKSGSVRFYRALTVREAIAQGKNPSEWVETFKNRGQVVPKRFIPDRPTVDGATWITTYPYSLRELLEVGSFAAGRPDWELEGQGRVYSRGARPVQASLL